MPALPFKLNQDRRRHIPEQKRKVVNWREDDESLRRRGSLTVWFSDEVIEAWKASPRTGRGGRPEYSDLAILTGLTLNRDRGASHEAAPPTPPGIRVRTTAVRRIKRPPTFPWSGGPDGRSELW